MTTCSICGHGLAADRALWTTCQVCQDRIVHWLAEIERLWPLLSECLEPGRGPAGPRVSGTGHGATLPVDETVLDLIGPTGVPTRLYWRYAELALARRLQPAQAPTGSDARLASALRRIRWHLPWAVQGADLRELSDELRKMAGELAAVVDRAARAPAVPCPAELPDGAGRCTGWLRYDRDCGTAYCRTCHTELDPSQWLTYWVQLGQPSSA